MLKFTMKRLVYLVLVLVGVSFLVFLLLYMTPGDPVRMMLGESATPEAQAELRILLFRLPFGERFSRCFQTAKLD